MYTYEKIVVVTRQTPLEALTIRFNTREQARFYIEHLGGSFEEYEQEHAVYHEALCRVRTAIPAGVRTQFIERAFLPTFTFGPGDLVATLGPDGLVVNTAKYLTGQPLLAFNPDPTRIEGVLLPFCAAQAGAVLALAVRGVFPARHVTMAKAELGDGQRLYAVNDLFIGQATHTSSRYVLNCGPASELQSSSGIIVSTGAGSTGWLRSVVTGAAGIVATLTGRPPAVAAAASEFAWDADRLFFSVREPFPTTGTGAELTCGAILPGQRFTVESRMPRNGVIFSDGIEADYLAFNSGAVAQIGIAEQALHLLVPQDFVSPTTGADRLSGEDGADK